MQKLTFGTDLKNLVENFFHEKVKDIEIVTIGKKNFTINTKGLNNKEIQIIMDSLQSPISREELDTLSKGGGVEIEFLNDEGCSPYSKDIIKTDNGLFYKGRRIVLHITEAHYDKTYRTPVKELHRYHLHYCEELKKQKAKGNLEKYRVSLSKDGTFHYVFKEHLGGVVKNQKLNVCRRCLSDFNPDKDWRLLDVQNFSLQDFFNSQSETIQNGDSPKLLFNGLNIEGMDFDYNTLSAEYSENWREISIARKKAENYTCQECGWKPLNKKDKKFIHTHHLDKNKSNNLSSNLKVLCLECHSNYHPTLKNGKIFKNNKKSESTNNYQIGIVTKIDNDKDKNGKYRKFIRIDNKIKALIYFGEKVYNKIRIGSKVKFIQNSKGAKILAII